MNRRRFLAGVGAGAAGLAGARAIDNVVLGYGTIGPGKNLRSQDLAAVASERLSATDLDDRGIAVGDDALRIRDDEIPIGDIDAAASADDARDRSGGPLEELARDVADLRAGAYRFEFHARDAFFSRLADAAPRPFTTDALRGPVDEPVDPDTVVAFTGAAPDEPDALLAGLKAGFREYGAYDVPRYVAGSVQDNVIMGRADLRRPFETPTDFDSLLEREHTGLFCRELAGRAIEALHALPAYEQSRPVAANWVRDTRHKHVYNGIASAIRDDGLVIPMTFVDYTYSTLYDDVRLTGLLGEGLDAYDDRHRADELRWDVPTT